MTDRSPQVPALPPLGRRLLAVGLLSSTDLDRAVALQASASGHLDTALLELGLIEEGQLLEQVAAVTGFPAASADDLRQITEETLALVPARLARRTQAIPFASTATTASVALVEPRNLAVHDELAFATGRRLSIHVALEVRIREALEKLYHEPMPARFGQLVDRLNRARYLWQEPASAVPSRRPLAPQSLPAPVGDGGPQPASNFAPSPVIPASSWTPPPLPLPNVRAAAAPGAAPSLDLDAFEARLSVLGDREQIGNHLVAFLRRSFPRVILFVAKRGEVAGWLGSGSGVDLGAVDAFRLSLDQPSLFADLEREGNFHVGPLPPLPVHRQLANLWGGQMPRRCLLLPVRIRERLVTVIYCEIDDSTPPIDVYALQRLAAATGQAFEFCIVRRKMDQASQ